MPEGCAPGRSAGHRGGRAPAGAWGSPAPSCCPHPHIWQAQGHSSPGSSAPPSPGPASPALGSPELPRTTDAARDEVPGQGDGSKSADCTGSFPQACGLPNSTSAVLLHCFSVLQKAQAGARAFRFILSTGKVAAHLAEAVLSTGVDPVNQQCKTGILNFSHFPGTDFT